MARVPAENKPIQIEETDERSPFSENMIQKMSGSINWILQNANISVIGGVRTAQLTEAQFQAANSIKWILSDGRSVVGSAFEALTGNSTVPDMRGLWLRMKQNNRDSGDITEELDLGSFQQKSIINHLQSHRIITFNLARVLTLGAIDEVGNDRLGNLGFNATNNWSSTSAFVGANENRPKTVTGNFFIRIN